MSTLPEINGTLPTDTVNGSTRAVFYLRVSTKEQAEKGGEVEGYSIPAQRDACKRKAVSLGATLIGVKVPGTLTGQNCSGCSPTW